MEAIKLIEEEVLNETKLFKNSIADRWFIMKKSKSSALEKIVRENFVLYSYAESEEGTKYQSLEILNYNDDAFFVKSLFRFLAAQDKTLYELVSQIEDFFVNEYTLTLEMARGMFAELDSILKDDKLIINHKNSIYDFVKNGIDYEIKSFSKSNPIIQVSKQQATNSSNAIFKCIEVFESNNGNSIEELLVKYSTIPKRYLWLKKVNSEFKKTKFKTGAVKEINIPKLFASFSLPQGVVDAKFSVNVEFF